MLQLPQVVLQLMHKHEFGKQQGHARKLAPDHGLGVAESSFSFGIASRNPWHQEMHEQVLQTTDLFIFVVM